MPRIYAFLLALAASAALFAQEQGSRSQGFMYFSFNTSRNSAASILAVGGGGEGFLYRGLAAGADLGYVFPRHEPGCGIGLLSVNPAYHFTNRERSRKLVPFVTGGYGLGFRSGSVNLVNYGGGLTYWLSSRAGLRFEVRDYRDRCCSLLLFRAGIAWR